MNQYYYDLAQIPALHSGIPAEWIYCQWCHETEYFTNWGATIAHNMGGLKQFKPQPDWFTGDAESPEGDNYQVFEDDKDYARYFGRYLLMYDGMREVKTIEDYIGCLKDGGYFGDSLSNYLRRVREIYAEEFGGEPHGL